MNDRTLAWAAAAGAVLIGAGVLAERAKSGHVQGAGTGITVAFSGGPSGTLATAAGQPLPIVTTTITNPDATLHAYTLSATSGPIPWTASQASFTLAAHGSKDLQWTATYEQGDGTGPYQFTLNGQVDSMPSQTFTDQQSWTLSVSVSPAQAALTFSGGPSGTVTIAEGGSQRLPTLNTTLTNAGQTQAAFTVTVAIQGPSAGRWFVYTSSGAVPANVTVDDYANVGAANSGARVTLGPGASVTIPWSTEWSSAAPSQDGSYTSVATVSW